MQSATKQESRREEQKRLQREVYEEDDDKPPALGLEAMLIDNFRAHVLEICHFNITHAAYLLGISLRSMRMWVSDKRDSCDFPINTRGYQYSTPDIKRFNLAKSYANYFADVLKKYRRKKR